MNVFQIDIVFTFLRVLRCFHRFQHPVEWQEIVEDHPIFKVNLIPGKIEIRACALLFGKATRDDVQ